MMLSLGVNNTITGTLLNRKKRHDHDLAIIGGEEGGRISITPSGSKMRLARDVGRPPFLPGLPPP